ncbi:hypothetical protein [Streptomyces sp. KLOTTS4A1]|uniref:hypothetical protein n=1 Tax=Streptomyces sp. KLOTTS4A1 TaxID=3390996 RepID=UPI0039F619BF
MPEIEVRLRPEQEEAVRLLAEARGLTPEAIVSQAIDELLAERASQLPGPPHR